MKILIADRDFDRWEKGDVIKGPTANEKDLKGWPHSSGVGVIIDFPEEFEELPLNILTGVKIEAQPAYWENGEDSVNEEPEDLTGWTYHEAILSRWEIQKKAGYDAYDKTQRVQELFTTLNTAVEVEMKQVYNTTNPDSAVANYLTWLSMKTNPAKYSDKGLIARFEIVGLSIGDALNTDEKVLAYSTALINLADDYAIWREQQILTYVAQKTAIENE
jgi:hypothetical protein